MILVKQNQYFIYEHLIETFISSCFQQNGQMDNANPNVAQLKMSTIKGHLVFFSRDSNLTTTNVCL